MNTENEFHKTGTGLLPFDPIVVVQDVLKRWLLILLAAAVVGSGSFILTDLRYEPLYCAEATVAISGGNSGRGYEGLSASASLARSFAELLNSEAMGTVILDQTTGKSFDGTVAAAVIPETNLITVSVTASDPGTAFLGVRAVLQRHNVVTDHVMGKVSLEVLNQPEVPVSPCNDSGTFGNTILMALTAAVIAAGAIGWASFSRDMVRSGREAKRKLTCSYLGELPHEGKPGLFRRKKDGIRITDPTTGYRYVETLRKLRRRVERYMQGEKVLMVTGLAENEGKTTVAANLALSLAQKYSRVLLVDFDLRRSGCSRLLQLDAVDIDIRDVLGGRAEPESAVVPYKKTGLDLLPARPGAQDGLPVERLQKLLHWAREHYDFVVLDLMPVSVAADLENVLECADAALLVVRQNGVPAPELNKGIDLLRSGKARLLGCVLNNVYSTVLSEGDGYGEYGGYDLYRYYSSGYSGKQGGDRRGK